MARGKDRQAQWEARFVRWRRSDVTVREFCDDEGVSIPSFYYWRRRLADDDCRHAADTVRAAEADGGEVARFLPLEVIGSAGDGMSAEICFPSGVSLRISNGVEESRLRALLRVLREERP